MLEKNIIKIVERQLKEYPYKDRLIEDIYNEMEFLGSRNKDLNSYLQSKGRISSSVENEVMQRSVLEEQINKHRKWKEVIETVLEIYKEYDIQKYNYMKMKFFTGNSVLAIELETTIGGSVQTRYKRDIILYIAIFAAQENLICMQKLNSIIKKRAKNESRK